MIKSFIGIVAHGGQPRGRRRDRPTITGTWNMGLEGDHVIPVALVLKQDGRHTHRNDRAADSERRKSRGGEAVR